MKKLYALNCSLLVVFLYFMLKAQPKQNLSKFSLIKIFYRLIEKKDDQLVCTEYLDQGENSPAVFYQQHGQTLKMQHVVNECKDHGG